MTRSTLPLVVELIVAQRLGRDLTALEVCLVQITALVVAFAVLYFAFTSGLATAVLKVVADWYASQVHFGPVATPVPTPNG